MFKERVKTFEGPEAGAGSGGGAPSPGFAAAVDAGLGGGGSSTPAAPAAPAAAPASPAAPVSGGGGGELPTTPGGASVVSDVELPENLRAQFGGAARLSEYHSGVQAQFRQMQDQVETLREYAAMLQERAAQTGNPADQAAANKATQQAGAVQQQAAQGWRGWKSKEEFFTDYKVRGVDAVADLAERIAEEKTRAAIEAFKAEQLNPALQPLFQQAKTAEMQRYEAQIQEFNQQQIEMRAAIEQKDKRFAKGGELAPAFQKYLQDNNERLLQAAQMGMDPYELARNHVLANVAAAVTPQAEEKMALVNALAGTARPGGGSPGVPQTGKRATAMESALALNAKRVAEGKPPLSAAELEQKAAWISQLGSGS